jgi:transposase
MAAVPWAYPGSSFTKEFDLPVTWLAKYLPRSAVANFMRINWQTVGSFFSRSLNNLEPERSRRLDGLVRIGIDETSYRKGHKYITVIVNHDTNTVVWVADGHGRSVLEQFYKALTDEQLASIKVVTGDGARWITDCVNEFTPDCERCVDPFHVVDWAMEALDEVRRDRWRAAYEKAKTAETRPSEN